MGSGSQARHLVFASPMTHRERLAREISARLLEDGVRVFPPSFPFGMHHEYYRTRIRPGGRHARRSDIADALTQWSETRESPDDYVWQAACGGLLDYFQRSPLHKEKLPPDIAGRMEVLGWGEDFRLFATELVSRQA